MLDPILGGSTAEPAASQGPAPVAGRPRPHPRRPGRRHRGAAVEQDDLGPGGVSDHVGRADSARLDRGPRPAAASREADGEPAPVPDPAEVEVPRALAQEIRQAMKRYPEKRSASIPALWAVQRRYGWCTPEGIAPGRRGDGRDPRLPAVGRELLRPLPPRAAGRARGAGLHQHLLLAARRRRPARRVHGGGRDRSPGTTSEDGKVFVRGFECLGACDLAPMASIDERYYGPLEPTATRRAAIEQLRAGEEVLPGEAPRRTAARRGGKRPRRGDKRAHQATP